MAPPVVSARFPELAKAEAASRTLAPTLTTRIVPDGSDLGTRETRFMGRIVILVALWSVFGTALGAGLGVLIAMVFGPGGTDGYVIQAVSWAVFAHLLAGMWAGYWLLADRSREDLPPRAGNPVLLVVECASIDDTHEVAAKLRELGGEMIESMETASGRVREPHGEQV